MYGALGYGQGDLSLSECVGHCDVDKVRCLMYGHFGCEQYMYREGGGPRCLPCVIISAVT